MPFNPKLQVPNGGLTYTPDPETEKFIRDNPQLVADFKRRNGINDEVVSFGQLGGSVEGFPELGARVKANFIPDYNDAVKFLNREYGKGHEFKRLETGDIVFRDINDSSPRSWMIFDPSAFSGEGFKQKASNFAKGVASEAVPLAIEGVGGAIGSVGGPVGAGAGTAMGNILNQQIGNMMSGQFPAKPVAFNPLEAAAAGVAGGVGEAFIGPALKGVFKPGKALQEAGPMGKFVQGYNAMANSPYQGLVHRENRAVAGDMIKELSERNLKDAGLSLDVPSDTLALNKALAKEIPEQFSSMKKDVIGKEMNAFKQSLKQPSDLAGMNQVLDEIAFESSHPDIAKRVEKIKAFLTKVQNREVPLTPEEVAALKQGLIPDETGEPKRFFHGTSATFDKFDTSKLDSDALYGKGIYHTDSPEVAGGYSDKIGEGKRRWEYLGDKNPRNTTDTLIERIKQNSSVIDSKIMERDAIKQVKDLAERMRKDEPYDHVAERLFVKLSEWGIPIDDIAKTTVTPNIRPAYLKVKNPFDMDQPAKNYFKALKSYPAANPPKDIKQWIDRAFKEESGQSLGSLDGVETTLENNRAAYEWAQAKGIDWGTELAKHEDYIHKKGLENIANYMKGWKSAADESKPATGTELFKEIQRNLSNWNNASNPDYEQNVMRKLGFDGIVHTGGANTGTKAHKVAIAFDSEQVVPAFDPKIVQALGKSKPQPQSPLVSELIERFQNLNSNKDFSSPTDPQLQRQLMKVKDTIKTGIDKNIDLAAGEKGTQEWRLLNKAYSRLIEGNEDLVDAISRNKDDAGRETINKIIDNPALGYEKGLPQGGIPPRIENLASRGLIQERLADKIKSEPGVSDLVKMFSDPKKVDELKSLLGTENSFAMNEFLKAKGMTDNLIPEVPLDLKKRNVTLVDELARILGHGANVAKPATEPYSKLSRIALGMDPLTQGYYNPRGSLGRVLAEVLKEKGMHEKRKRD